MPVRCTGHYYNHWRPFSGSKHVDPANVASVQGTEMNTTGLFACPGLKATTLKDMVGGVAEVLPANKLATKEDADKVAATAMQNDGRHAGDDKELTRSI
uniref:SMP domain-containing protein n=1 Tax=Oryza barthii TaxID=65489 RepID=A0A0D3ENN1_9ORYZ